MSRLHIVLVAPEIHWNTGNIGRTSLAVDAELHLVQPLGFSLDDREIRRAGLDYWPRVRLTVWPTWDAFEAELPRLGQPFFFSTRGTRVFTDAVYPEATVLVFGRESVGLPQEVLAKYANATMTIPMGDPQLRSLNLSTSAAVAAYEVRRQWGTAQR
jgi:tRNA (cytidine/uridine-2'-O-)-methyltransferase